MHAKTVDVVAAVIVSGLTVLATQRGYGEWAGWWEFPGGKVEPGEVLEEALAREIREELGAVIDIQGHLCTVEHDYSSFHLHMECFTCTLADNAFELLEHHAAKWLDRNHLEEVQWLPADLLVVDALKESGII